MTTVLVATKSGCRTFTDKGEGKTELAGCPIWPLASNIEGGGLAVVNGNEIWRRACEGTWSQVGSTAAPLASILSAPGTIFGGAMSEAAIFQIHPKEGTKRLSGFDETPGRNEWFPQGPPLHIRSLAITANGKAMMAAVHVGGIPRTTDGGKSWTPTIPINHDVHEIRAHPSLSLVAAATAFGLYVSQDAGETWVLIKDGLDESRWPELLAVTVLNDEVLFSAQEGGAFAKQSQIWRLRIGDKHVERVREGLPEWLEGKVDTNKLSSHNGRAAILDGGGNLYLSTEGSKGWKCLATHLEDAYAIIVL